MKVVSESHICVDLENAKYLKYDTTLEECVEECENDINNCLMINYVPNVKSSTDSRCYIFDKQCEIYADNNALMAIRGFQGFCNDYPSDWTDRYKDTCYQYPTFNWCLNGQINTVNVSVDKIVDHADFRYNLNANEVCCECGGGIQSLENDITITFQSSVDNNGLFEKENLICEWEHGSNEWRQYDNLQLFDLCLKLTENVYKNYKFLENQQSLLNEHINDIDCDMFIDKGYRQPLSINICNNYTNQQELYFMNIFTVNSTNSMTIFLNGDWFNISRNLLSQHIIVNYMDYSQCSSILKSMASASYYATFPCEIENKIITSQPTNEPTISPSAYPTKIPTQSPQIIPEFEFSTSMIFAVESSTTEENKWYQTTGFMVLWAILGSIFLIFVIIISYIIYKKSKESDGGGKGKYSVTPHDEYPNVDKVNELAPISTEDPQANVMPDPTAPLAENNGLCYLCCEEEANIFNYPCGHVTFCNDCVEFNMVRLSSDCPSCRQNVQEFKRIYPAGFQQ